MPNRINRPPSPAPRVSNPDPAAPDDSAAATDGADPAATGPAAPATPTPDVPSDPSDRVSDFVDRSTRISTTAPDPRVDNRTVSGRSVFDVRLDTGGGGAGVTRDISNPDNTRTGDLTGRVDIDAGGVRTSGGADVRRTDGDRDRHSVGNASVHVAPDGRVGGRAAGTHTDSRTVGDNRVTDRLGGEISHDAGTTRYSGTAGRSTDGPTGNRSDDVRLDGSVSSGGTSHTVRGEHRRTRDGVDLRVGEDLTVRTDRAGTHLDGGVNVDRTVTDDNGTRRDAGRFRGTTGPDGRFSVDVGGERDRRDAGGSSNLAGGATLTNDTVRVHGAGERTVTDGTNTSSLRGDGAVTVGPERSVTANGSLTGSTDTVLDDGARVSRTGTLSGSGTGDGAVRIDATGRNTVTGPDGSTTDRRGGAHLDVGPGRTDVTVEGGFENRRTDEGGTTTTTRGDATGNVRADSGGTNLSGSVSGSRDFVGPLGSGRDHGEVRGSGDTTGRVTVTASGTTERRDDAGSHHATGTVTVDNTSGSGRVAYNDARNDDTGRTERRIDADGRVDGSGVSGRVGGEHRRTDNTGDVTAAGGEVRGRTGGGAHTVGATGYVENNDADAGRRVRVETRGDMTVDAGGVRGSGAVEGNVTVTDDEEARRYRGIASSDGGRPTLGVRVETESNDRRSTTNVEANVDTEEVRGSLLLERRRTNDAGHTRNLSVAVDGHVEGVDARIEAPRTDGDGSTRFAGTASVHRGGVDGGIEGSTRRGNTDRTRSVTGGVNAGRVTAGGRYTVTTDGRVARSGVATIEHGGGETHSFLAGSEEWATRYGRIGVALSGHFGRTDRVTDMGAIPERGGAHRLMLETGSQLEGAAGGGITVGLVGARAAGRAGKFTHMTYVTHRDPAEAARLSSGPAKPEMPDIADPMALVEGDVVQLYRAGDMGLSADLAFAGVTFSGRVSVRGAFRFVVERMAGNKVRITASPEKVNTVGVGARVLIADGALDVSKAKAFTQTFDLDLGTPEGIAAYQKALEGDLPDLDVQNTLTSGQGALVLVDNVNRTLPAGVRAVAFSHTAADTVTTRVGVSWAFFGSTRDDSRTTSTTTRVEDGVLVEDRSTRRDVNRRTWFSGVERSGCFASVRHVTREVPGGTPVSEFGAIEFGAHFSDDKTVGPELENLVEHIGGLFGFGWQGDGLRGYGERRAVEFALVLDAAALTALSQRQLDGLEDAAKAVGIETAGARDLYSTLKSNTQPAERADKLQAYIAKHGVKGLAVLVRAFPHLKLDVRAETAAYDKAAGNAQDEVGRFNTPVVHSEASDFASRFNQVSTALREVNVYFSLAEKDPLLTDDVRKRLLDHLGATKDALEASLDLSHLSRDQLELLRQGLVTFASHPMDLRAIEHVVAFRDAAPATPA